MKNLRPKNLRPSVLLATCAILAAMPRVAHAAIVSGSTNPADALTSSGFGNAPRLLTLDTTQNPNWASGGIAVMPGPTLNVPTGLLTSSSADVVTGANESQTRLLTTPGLDWTSGANVGIGFAPNQAGATGITLQDLRLTLYSASTGAILTIPGPNSTVIPAVFNLLNGPLAAVNYTGFQGGTGSNAFALGLDFTQRQTFDDFLSATPGGAGAILAGLSATIGCPPGSAAGCLVTNAAADSFIGANFQNLVFPGPTNPDITTPPPMPPVPEIPLPASFPLFASGLVGMGLLGWRRKRKSTTSALAA